MSDFPKRSLQIDEEGYWLSNGVRINDIEYGRELLQRLTRDERGRFFSGDDVDRIFVENFDEPLIVRLVERQGEQLIGHFPYQWTGPLDLATFSVDEWDRFHGRTAGGIPYVLSRAAQAALFDAVDEFDDSGLSFAGRRFEIGPWLEPFQASKTQDFWSDIYQNGQPGWELGQESVILPPILPQLKIPRQRIAVLGCGSGHDAAFFARAGHLVTGIDFSDEAIARAQKSYGDIADLKFVKADIFNLPTAMNGQFDVVFEHTCYCAVDPSRRNELIKVWMKLLAERGHLLGLFFVMDKRQGPPWGGSEWETRERLKRHFDFRFWTRWQKSIERRQGCELVVWAQAKQR
ncbi:MAG: class I SAM-dependent methyltransferase [Bdellovibrionales bacterium]